MRAFTRLFPEKVSSVLLLDTVWPTIYRDFLPSYASPWHEGGTSVDLKTSARVIGSARRTSGATSYSPVV